MLSSFGMARRKPQQQFVSNLFEVNLGWSLQDMDPKCDIPIHSPCGLLHSTMKSKAGIERR
jgi:hypothetical protein